VSAGATPVSGAFDPARFAARLWDKDATLWSADPAHQKVAGNRLGWLDLPATMAAELEELDSFVGEVRAEGFTRVVLLGMGGSSLAPEVMRRMLGVRDGFLELTVLDNTSPAAVRAVADTHDPAHTLFLVSSKSGGTIEVDSFERHFYEWVKTARGDRVGRSFVAITDPGSPLAARAVERGYARTFLNPADVGGRYSALSLFGLVPAALIGADTGELLASAGLERERSRSDPRGGPGVVFGHELGEAARAGRDKLTLAFGPGWEPFGAWVEQLVAESTGKDGRGVVPVDGEALGVISLAGVDRSFAVTPDLDRALGHRLAHGNAPAWLVDLDAPHDLGAAFLRWEIATATAGAVLGVDPFDEPNVSEAKQATQAVLDRAQAEGRFPEPEPLARGAGWRLYACDALADDLRAASGPRAALDALLQHARPSDYLALLAYLHPNPAIMAALKHVREITLGRVGLATTLGIGPRFLHSTGQLHKGGAPNGLFLQITVDEDPDVPIPGRPFTFGTLRRAQAAGDFEVLARRGRRVVRLHLEREITEGITAIAGT
jgi:glucose-6-phosphate isomerase